MTQAEKMRQWREGLSLERRETIREADRLRSKTRRREYTVKTQIAVDRCRYAKQYGIAPKDFEAMLVSQMGRCASCGDPMRKPCVDHNHSTGRVRSLLCSGCNTAFGLLAEDPEKVRALLVYATHQKDAG